MILDHLSLVDYFSISGVSLQARSFVLPTLHALTLREKLQALKRAAEDDHYGAIIELSSMLRSDITEPGTKFFLLHTLFSSSCTKGMRIWLADLAPSGQVTDHQWRKEESWKETLKSAMQSSKGQALELAFEYGAPISAIIDFYPFDDPVRDMSPSLSKAESYYLHHAVIRGYQAAVDFLLTRDGDAHINKTDPDGRTPLIFAVKCGWTGIVASLLAHNADVDLASNKKGDCVLQCALEEGHESIALMLIDHGADIEFTDEQRNTALHYAVRRDSDGGFEKTLPILKKLVERGMNLAAVNVDRLTPIQRAVVRRNIKAVEFLWEKSLDANPYLRDGSVLLSGALAANPEMVALIVSHGADGNRVPLACFEGQTPLQCVIEFGCLESARILQEAGADPSKRDMHGLDAWDYAEGSDLDFDFEDVLGQRP